MVTVGTLIAVAVDGLAFGVILALLGVGITLVFGLGEVLNLAIGVFAVLSVLVAWSLTQGGMGLVLAVLLGLVFVAVAGLVVDRTLLTPVYRSAGEQRILLGIFTTLGLTVFLEGILINGITLSSVAKGLAVPAFPASYQLPLSVPNVPFAGTVILGSSLVVIVIGAVVLAGLFVFLGRTFLGKATRTVFQDEVGAQLVGVEPRRIRTLIFVLSVTVAGVGGLLWASSHNISVSSGFHYTTFALIVSIVGGVRSLTGAIVAGVLLGFVNQFASYFVGSSAATVILFGAAVVFLLAKPEAIS